MGQARVEDFQDFINGLENCKNGGTGEKVVTETEMKNLGFGRKK